MEGGGMYVLEDWKVLILMKSWSLDVSGLLFVGFSVAATFGCFSVMKVISSWNLPAEHYLNSECFGFSLYLLYILIFYVVPNMLYRVTHRFFK